MDANRKFEKESLGYFSADGNFGSIDAETPLIVVSTSGWTDEIFELLDEVDNYNKILLVERITKLLKRGKPALEVLTVLIREIEEGKYE